MLTRAVSILVLATAGQIAACTSSESVSTPSSSTAEGSLPAPARALIVRSAQRLSDRLIELRVFSSAMESETRVRVLLPTGYDPRRSRSYPVSYLLHGCCSNGTGYSSWSDSYDLVAFTEAMDVVFVMPEAGNSGLYSDWYNAGAGGPPRWESYHIRELAPWIEQNFHVRRDRGGRMLFGISMGGHGALAYAAKYPHYFGSAAAVSPTIDTNTLLAQLVLDDGALLDGGVEDGIWGPRITEEARWRGHNPFDLAENLGRTEVFIRSGNGRRAGSLLFLDVAEAAVHEMSVNVSRELDRLGIPHQFDDYGFGTHTPDFWQQGLHLILPQQLALAALPARDPRGFSYRSIEPRFEVFDWTVSIQREVLEFARLGDVSERGFSLSGSGVATVISAAWFLPRGSYSVEIDGVTSNVMSDDAGRLRLTVNLGPSRTLQEFRLGSPPGYRRTVVVRIGTTAG